MNAQEQYQTIRERFHSTELKVFCGESMRLLRAVFDTLPATDNLRFRIRNVMETRVNLSIVEEMDTWDQEARAVMTLARRRVV